MTTNITRMANSDGIIAIRRAGAAAEDQQEGDEDDHHRQPEALRQRRHQVLRDLGLQRRQPDDLAA